MAKIRAKCIHEYLGIGAVICHHEETQCHLNANGEFKFTFNHMPKMLSSYEVCDRFISVFHLDVHLFTHILPIVPFALYGRFERTANFCFPFQGK